MTFFVSGLRLPPWRARSAPSLGVRGRVAVGGNAPNSRWPSSQGKLASTTPLGGCGWRPESSIARWPSRMRRGAKSPRLALPTDRAVQQAVGAGALRCGDLESPRVADGRRCGYGGQPSPSSPCAQRLVRNAVGVRSSCRYGKDSGRTKVTSPVRKCPSPAVTRGAGVPWCVEPFAGGRPGSEAVAFRDVDAGFISSRPSTSSRFG